MKAIHPTLATGQQGAAVANLHAILDKLGLGGLVTELERVDQQFGEGTIEAISRFQAQFGIATHQPGVVLEDTAELINNRLFDIGVFSLVMGRVINRDGSAVAGNLLFVFDKDNVGGALLGQTNINADGFYNIYYDPLFYVHPDDGVIQVKDVIDLVVQVYDANGATIAESSPVHAPLNKELVDLQVGDLSAPDGHQFTLRGQVMDASGPLNGIRVRVFDRDIFFGRSAAVTGQLLGSITTKQNPETGIEGWFELTYSTSQFASGDIEKDGSYIPDLVFVLNMDDQAIEGFALYRLPDGHDFTEEVLVSDDDLILGISARKDEEVRFVISGGEQKREESEYDRIWRAILPLVVNQPPEKADEAEQERLVCAAAAQFDEEKHRDIMFVARETGLDWALIRTFADASKLSVDPFRQDVPVSVLYGLARTRGASDFYRLSLLSENDLRLGLEEATAGTRPIIPSFDSADRLKETIQLLRNALANRLPSYRAEEGATTLTDLIGADIPDREDQTILWRTFSEHSGTPAEFWDKLKSQPGFEDESKVNKVKYASQLGWLAQNNIPLVNAIRNKHPEISSTVELAFHLDTTDKWGALLNDTVVSIPSDVPGTTDSERKENYAASLAVAMQVAHPTVAIANMVATLPLTQLANVQPGVSKFLADAVRTAQFDLVSDRIDDLVANHGDKLFEAIDIKDRPIVVNQVKRLQRLFRLSCGPESMKALIDAGFNSARDIAELPPDVAMDMLSPALGEITARIILNRAGNISSEALHQYVFFNGLINDKGLNGEFL